MASDVVPAVCSELCELNANKYKRMGRRYKVDGKIKYLVSVS